MKIGEVTPDREAIIRLQVNGTGGRQEDIEAVLDTGYNGELTLPLALIAALGLSLIGSNQATLADGSMHRFDVYSATVVLGGQTRRITVLATGSEPLVGMALLYGFRVILDVIDGGDVTMTLLP